MGEQHFNDAIRKLIAWWKAGFMSITSRPAEVDSITRLALEVWDRQLKSSDPSESDDTLYREVQSLIDTALGHERVCNNTSLVRVVPLALSQLPFHELEESQLRIWAGDLSSITHPHILNRSTCILYVQLVQACSISSESDKEFLATYFTECRDQLSEQFLSNPSIIGLASRFQHYDSLEAWRRKPAAEIRPSSHVLDTFEAALWAFFTTSTFEQGALRAINLGGDAGTIGAVYGGLAGAFYGLEQIRQDWIEVLRGRVLLREVAESLSAMRQASVQEHSNMEPENDSA